MDMPSQDMLEEMFDLLQSGMDFSTMLECVGVSKRKMTEWIKKGQAEGQQSIYHEMVRQMKQATAMCDLRDLRTIDMAAAKGDWKAAAWRLERRRPHVWGLAKLEAPQDSVEKALEEPTTQKQDLSKLTVEELKALRALNAANLRQVAGDVYEET